MSTLSAEKSVSLKSNKKRLILLVIIPVALVIIASAIYLHSGRFVETDNAYVKADIVPVSARISGTVTRVVVIENQQVGQGDLLFVLDPESFQVNVSRAAAKLDEVSAKLKSLQASYLQQQANIRLEESNYAYTQRELARQNDLKGKNFVSASVLDDLAHRVELSKQKLTVMQYDLNEIVAALGGTVGAPLEQHPSYLSALADLDEAKYELKYTEIRAPVSGVVSKLPKVGQYLREGNTISALVSDHELWIEANFPETDLTYVHAGQSVAIHVDTYPDDHWDGEVESISPATGAEFSLLPPQNATGNWVKVSQRVPVRIKVIPGENAPSLRVGLSAVVTIDTQHIRSILGMTL